MLRPYLVLSDHLGSTSTTANEDGTWNSTIQYTAFGEIRLTKNTTPTKYRYTSQLAQAELGLDYYVARFYDPLTGHFTQADSVIPEPGKASAFDRYAYVLNNPIRYSDPSGHGIDSGIGDSGYDRSDDLKRWREFTRNNNQKDKRKRVEISKSFHFDSMEFANLPSLSVFSPDQLRETATNLDKIALGLDIIAESVVVTYAGIGFLGISFEGSPVVGIVGAGAGWVLAQSNPVVRLLLTGGNVLASVASGLSSFADVKTGSTRFVGSVTISNNMVSIRNNLNISSNTEISIVTSSFGWGAANLTESSIIFQAIAVANDMGNMPKWDHSLSLNYDSILQ